MPTRIDVRTLFAAVGVVAIASGAMAATPVVMQVRPASTATVQAPPAGAGVSGVQANEIDTAIADDGEDLAGAAGKSALGGRVVNRSIAKSFGKGAPTRAALKAKSNPQLVQSFDGLNLRQQRLANGGNQFTVEPPDQALCVGNGFVLESVNDVLRIFDTAGNAATGVIDLNTFYGYPAAINRANGKYGPSITDPVCLFDQDTQRWFHVVLTLDRVGTTSALSGTNHLDIAVSSTADPRDPWVIYKLPVQNDGTEGTPNHGCDGGPCLGDYPHIGADANGIYLTTNEFALFGDGFYGAQIYALSKRALASHAASVPVVLFNTGDPSVPYPGFTVWPATSAGPHAGNTEFLMSSLAVFTDDGTSNQVLIWSLSNTQSIDSASPNLALNIRPVTTLKYGVPPPSVQKAGSTPLRDCIANVGLNCSGLVLGVPSVANPIYDLDSSDSRMQQVYYANGKLWAALGTAVAIDGDPSPRAGIAYFVINPNSGGIFQQGIVAVKGNNVTYPAVAVTKSGRGAIAFTLVGEDHHPSAGYVSLDAKIGAGEVHVAAAGAGPADGFSGYLPYSDRPRWGDYGAAATDGDSIWIASEYIAQTCTYAQWLTAPIGSCGGTRTSLANWATRITQLAP